MDVATQAGWTVQNWRSHYDAVKRRIYTQSMAAPEPAKALPPPEPVKKRILPWAPSLAMLKLEQQRQAAADLVEQAVLTSTGGERMETIIRSTAGYFNVTVGDIISPRRDRKIINARFVAIYLCKSRTTLSLPRIGYRFGRRDHTTILHAVRAVEKHIGSEDELGVAVREISARLDAKRSAGVEGRQEGDGVAR